MARDRDILILSLLTFVTVILWIFFELVKTTKTATVTAGQQTLVTPLSTSIDMETLRALGERKTY